MNDPSIAGTEKLLRQQLGKLYGPGEASAMAWWVLEHVTGRRKAALLAGRAELLGDAKIRLVNRILDRLLEGEPLQYVLGESFFYGLKLRVTPSVLVPRPETEELADWVIRDAQGALSARETAGTEESAGTGKAGGLQSDSSGPAVLDIGTGSGCIAIALKKNLPRAQVWACDISEAALAIATENAERQETAVRFLRADILDRSSWTKFPAQDIIVSNPPYVTREEMEGMLPHVLDFEPHLALFVENDDPLLFYRNIAAFAAGGLKAGGRLYFEINEAFGKEVVSLLGEKGFRKAELWKDLNGKDRMVRAFKDEVT